MQRNVGNNSAI